MWTARRQVRSNVVALAALAAVLLPGRLPAEDQPVGTPSQAVAQVTAATSTPGEARIRAMITAAWDDATATWSQILGAAAYERDTPRINFVSAVNASHCYGLYLSAGPVYCFGNNTVFVSLGEMQRLDNRIAGLGDEGLAFLVAHELGHHVQKVTGRLGVLNSLSRSSPGRQRELSLRFELEADCLAGVWAGKSAAFAESGAVRTSMLASLEAIGDDKVQLASYGRTDPSTYTHGTSAQRSRWFKTGLDGGSAEACAVLEAADY